RLQRDFVSSFFLNLTSLASLAFNPFRQELLVIVYKGSEKGINAPQLPRVLLHFQNNLMHIAVLALNRFLGHRVGVIPELLLFSIARLLCRGDDAEADPQVIGFPMALRGNCPSLMLKSREE